MINPGSDVVVLPPFSCVGDVVQVQVSAVSIAQAASIQPEANQIHVFPAPGEPVIGCIQAVRHDIETNGAQPVRCGPRCLAPAGLRTEQECVKDMLEGGQIELNDSPWASPVVLVTKKDCSTRFCVDYRWLNSVTVKDAYPLPRIDDSLRLLGNQQWFSTMDLASGYWQVAMSLDAKRKAALLHMRDFFSFR